MAVNAVAPWEGALDWIGEVKSGQTQKGTWKSVDFALKYQDHQMNEKTIVFSAFGEDKVDKLLATPYGTMLKVVWWPEATQGRNSGVWYGKNSAISIGSAQSEAKSADTKITAPSYPAQGTQMPNPGYRTIPQPVPPLPPMPDYNPDPDNLPF